MARKNKVLCFKKFTTLTYIKEELVSTNNEIMTVKELSEYLKIAEKTAYRLVSSKKVPGFKIGGSWRFRKSEIDAWINEQEKANK